MCKSDRTIIVLLLLLTISCRSFSEHIDRPDAACSSQATTTLRQTQPTSTDHTITIENEIDVMTYQREQENIVIHARGGHVDSSSSISLDSPSIESIAYDLNTITDRNSDNKSLPSWNLSFSITQPGDGSQYDRDGIPTRFLLMQKNHRGNAIQALQASKAWREKHSVDTILSRPHPNYDIYKAIFPVFLAGRDPTGHIIFVEQLGKIDAELAKRKNISLDELIFHFVYMVEYCWNILDRPPHQLPSSSRTVTSPSQDASVESHPRSPGTMVTIMDCEGVTISSLLGFGKTASENRKFLLKFVQTISDHYPLRSYKTLIINAPHWIHGIYQNLVRPLLRESSREKIKLFQGGKEQQEVLSELGLFTDGHENKSLLDIARKSSMEQHFRNFVQEILRQSGEAMKHAYDEPNK